MELRLRCLECGHVTVLSLRTQLEMLLRLRLPAQREIVECVRCQKYQWALGRKRAIAK
jgi:hypothetical protein